MIEPREAMGLVWALWAASWFAAAFWADRTTARADLKTEATYRLVLSLGFVALFLPLIVKLEPAIVWWPGFSWLFVLVALAGFGFCWWARLHLGPLWSATITRKEDHRIVDTGPYRLVRHPIYTGLLAASVAAALLQAHLLSLLGLVAVLAGFYQKARYEEQFLRQELGAETYDAYAARVPMLIPHIDFKLPKIPKL